MAQYFIRQGCASSKIRGQLAWFQCGCVSTSLMDVCCRWKEGYCHFGDRCNFAHGEHELRYVPPEVVSQFEQHKRMQDQAGLGPGGPMLPVGPALRPPPPAGPMPPPRPPQSMTPPRQQGAFCLYGNASPCSTQHSVQLKRSGHTALHPPAPDHWCAH